MPSCAREVLLLLAAVSLQPAVRAFLVTTSYTLCLAAPRASTLLQGDCMALSSALAAAYSPWQGVCSLAPPTGITNVPWTSYPMFYSCTTTSSFAVYTGVVVQVGRAADRRTCSTCACMHA